MKRSIITLLASFLLISTISAADLEIEAKINELNGASLSSLGISLNALTYLIQASGEGFIPLWYLEESGNIQFIQELEKSGYVRVNITQGLPDGSKQNDKFVNIVPLQNIWGQMKNAICYP